MTFGKLADLFVEVGVKDETSRGLGKIRGMLSGWAGEARRALTIPVAIAGGVGGAALGKFLWDSVQAAGDLNETLSKVGVVFGDQAATVIKYADEMADSFGLVKTETLEAAAGIANILKASGLAGEEMTRLSLSLTTLADDLASQDNLQFAEALEKIRSGIVGEAEPLRRYGVLLSEAAMKAKAAELGIGGMNGALSEADKVMARVAIIQEQLVRVTGDHARTSDSLANRQKQLAGDFKNLQAEIGSALIDPMRELIDLVYDLGNALDGTFSNDRAAAIAKLGGAVSGAVGNVSSVLVDKSGAKGGGMMGSLGGNTMVGRFLQNTMAEGLALFGFEGMRRDMVSSRMAQNQKAKALGDVSKPSDAYSMAAGAAPPSGPPVPMRRVDTDAVMFGMLLGQGQMESEILAGAAQDYARKGIGGRIKEGRANLADMEQARRGRLAQGGVLGDQLSSINSMQHELLNDLPRQQLEVAKKQLNALETIAKGVEAGDMGAVRMAEAVLAE